MKAYSRFRGLVPLILNFGIRWGEWSASRPCRFSSSK